MRTSDRTRRLGGGLLGGIGVVTFAIHVGHLLSEGETALSLATGVLFPMLTSALLVLAGYLTIRGTVGEERVDRVVGWSLGGMVWLGLLALVTFLYLQSEGVVISHRSFVVINFLSVGGATGFLIGVYDERVQVRTRQLHARERELQRQNQQLERFASVVAHDLRNPLNVAHGRAQMVRRDHESEHLSTLLDALGRMNDIVDDVLSLARQGQRVVEPERVALHECVEDAWGTVGGEDVRETVHGEDARGAVDNEAGRGTVDNEDAPGTVDGEGATLEVEGPLGVVLADGSRLRQLFENLFRNAIEHAGPDVSVRVGRTDDGFFVEDDGPGIPEGERERAFEFGRTTSEDGTGLGLSIVRLVVEAHGWTVELAEGEAGGTRVEVRGVEFLDERRSARTDAPAR